MEKNITVVDEQGNQYETTYPKRAKGLVKHGRARFVNDHKICLACPPKIETEDITMSENTENVEIATTKTYTEEYLFERSETLAAATGYLVEAIRQCNDPAGGEARAMALGNMVEHREKTNRQLIAFYQEAYNKMRPATANEKEWHATQSKEWCITQLMEILREDSLDEDKDRAERIIREYMHS